MPSLLADRLPATLLLPTLFCILRSLQDAFQDLFHKPPPILRQSGNCFELLLDLWRRTSPAWHLLAIAQQLLDANTQGVRDVDQSPCRNVAGTPLVIGNDLLAAPHFLREFGLSQAGTFACFSNALAKISEEAVFLFHGFDTVHKISVSRQCQLSSILLARAEMQSQGVVYPMLPSRTVDAFLVTST